MANVYFQKRPVTEKSKSLPIEDKRRRNESGIP
jgi:hypothetical protein